MPRIPVLSAAELGCGTGELLASLAPSYGVGIDFAQAPLDRARACYPHLTFALGDAEDQATLEKVVSLSPARAGCGALEKSLGSN
jgi:trans-aconitate methyltransferase